LCLPIKTSALSAPSAVNKKDLLTAEYTEKPFINGKPKSQGLWFPIKTSALSAPSAVNKKGLSHR